MPNSVVTAGLSQGIRRRERERHDREDEAEEERHRILEETRRQRLRYFQLKAGAKAAALAQTTGDPKVDLDDDDNSALAIPEHPTGAVSDEIERAAAEAAAAATAAELERRHAAEEEERQRANAAAEEAEQEARVRDEAERRRREEEEVAKSISRQPSASLVDPVEHEPDLQPDRPRSRESPHRRRKSIQPSKDDGTPPRPPPAVYHPPQAAAVIRPVKVVKKEERVAPEMPSILHQKRRASFNVGHPPVSTTSVARADALPAISHGSSHHTLPASRRQSLFQNLLGDKEGISAQSNCDEDGVFEVTEEQGAEAWRAWHILKQAAAGGSVFTPQQEHPEIEKVMAQSWFPDFKHDFPDPMQDIITPQLELIHDDSWQFRTQTCRSLGAYRIYHLDIIFALLGRLKDSVESVRNAALRSLATFGIVSSESLRYIMVRMKMIDGKVEKSHRDWLDDMLDSLNFERGLELSDSMDLVERWRRKIDRLIQGRQFQRPPSSYATLVVPEAELRMHASKIRPMLKTLPAKKGPKGSALRLAGRSNRSLADPSSSATAIATNQLRLRSSHDLRKAPSTQIFAPTSRPGTESGSARATSRGGSRRLPDPGDFRSVLTAGVPRQFRSGTPANGERRAAPRSRLGTPDEHSRAAKQERPLMPAIQVTSAADSEAGLGDSGFDCFVQLDAW
ncbi:hypothetical protein HK405_008247 [Cladochytrium tenue]|nr:hypothetical protein HK405_008247 [Cladochytrium tenue]